MNANALRHALTALCAVVALCLFPDHSSAQTMSITSYVDDWDDGNYLYADVYFEDYSTGCDHWDYGVTASFSGPTGSDYYSDYGVAGSVHVPLGGGDFTVDASLSILCSCFGGWGVAAWVQDVIQRPTPPTISGASELWWFDGYSPSGYNTSVVLTSAGGASTSWTISAGSSIVSLSSNQGASVTVSSTGQSSNANDVTITATNAAGSDEHELTVRSPHRFEAGQVVTNCPSDPWGYETNLRYTIKDQLGDTIPNDVPISEDWTTGITNHYAGTNWRRADPGGFIVGSTWDDRVGAEHKDLPPNPTIQCSDATSIQSWGQQWRVGSTTPGQGKAVQNNTLMKRRGSAVHQSISSPP